MQSIVANTLDAVSFVQSIYGATLINYLVSSVNSIDNRNWKTASGVFEQFSQPSPGHFLFTWGRPIMSAPRTKIPGKLPTSTPVPGSMNRNMFVIKNIS